MSTTSSAKDSTTKTSTTARLALSFGPAAATADTRKNRKAHLRLSQNLSIETPQLDLVPQAIASISIPATTTCKETHNSLLAAIPYTPSETSATSSLFLPNHDMSDSLTSPSPPLSPSTQPPKPAELLTSTNTTDTTDDIVMDDPNNTPSQPSLPSSEDSTPRHPSLLSTPLTVHYDTPIDLAQLVQACLDATADHKPTSKHIKFTLCNPIEKYTDHNNFPAVHDAHPMAILDNIDRNQLFQWMQYRGDKLLAIPFDGEANDPRNHKTIKGKIFAAVAEIMQSESIGVSAPTQSPKALCTPTSFLIHNLMKEQSTTLLKHKIWSSTNITFHVSGPIPPCQDFLFPIKGFTMLITDNISQIVKEVWSDPKMEEFILTATGNLLETKKLATETSICQVINSMRVSHLDTKTSGNTLLPHFNVYADGCLITNDGLWLSLRDFLANRPYSSPMQGCQDTYC
ncbi:hypothetical protein F5148DRAFT_1283422 [Russula earlei]|uniref:Uncharacterized protein n=1 Tax=Russula earlei TaxID=71964 RepID=A0ACC0UBK3_9AGAM|nr:hypothetical protein F5148DRAFT_1283422 [Russula earlei]